MSGAAMQPTLPPPARRTRKQFDEAAFRTLHEGTGKMDFTPDFNASIEHFLRDPEVALREKILALIKLQAWGNQKELAVHDHARTSPFLESDVARYLKVSRQVVNRAVLNLEENYLLRREGRRLYPISDPVAERERRRTQESTPDIPRNSPNIRLALEFYFEHNSDQREKFQTAQKTFNEAAKTLDAIKRAATKAYRAAAKASTTDAQTPENETPRVGQTPEHGADTLETTGRTPSGPILIEIKEQGITAAAAFSSLLERDRSAAEESTEPPPPPQASGPVQQQTPEPNEAEVTHLENVMEASTGERTDRATVIELVQRCRQHDAQATVFEISELVMSRAPRKRQPGFGFFLETVPGAFPLRRKVAAASAAATAAPELEQTIERERREMWQDELREKLVNPDLSDQERNTIQACLEMLAEE